MTVEAVILLAVLVGMAYLFLTEKFPVDLTALGGLGLLLVLGYLAPEQAFSGFSSPAIITMLATFIVGIALERTGITDRLAGKVAQLTGDREVVNVLAVMLLGVAFSTVMNNIAATAVLLPAAGAIAERSRVAPSKLLMPLAIATTLGGMCTLIGTPPNMIAADLLAQGTSRSLHFFSFTPVGTLLTLGGLGFMFVMGNRLLPRRNLSRGALRRGRDLTKVYRLFERLFVLRVPVGSHLSGLSLAESRFGELLGAQIVAVSRAGHRRLFPGAQEILADGDLLIVQGRQAQFEGLQRLCDVNVQNFESSGLKVLPADLSGARLRVDGDGVTSKSLQDLQMRDRYKVVVIAVERAGERLVSRLGAVNFVEGDELLVLGSVSAQENLGQVPGLSLIEGGLPINSVLPNQLFSLGLPEGSALDGCQLEETRLGELTGMQVIGIVREGRTYLAPNGHKTVCGGDHLVVIGEREQAERIRELAALRLESLQDQTETLPEELSMAEVVLAPRSSALGKSLMELDYRERYGFQVLAIWREGRPYRTKLAEKRLQLGDALLLHGPSSRLATLVEDMDFVLLSNSIKQQRRHNKAWVAIFALVMMVVLAAARIQPVHIAAFEAALLVLIFGAVTTSEAYRQINWRVIFLVGALIPIGTAVEHTGLARLLGTGVVDWLGAYGPHVVLLGLCLLSSALSQMFDGALAVVLLAPVALSTAERMNLATTPLFIGIALAASITFLTPFSNKANLLVMGAGGYRSSDYFRVGWRLSVVTLILLIVLVPLIHPF